MNKIKVLIIAIICVAIGFMEVCGSSAESVNAKYNSSIELIEKISNDSITSSWSGYLSVYCFTDEETGIEYLIVTNEKAGAASVSIIPRQYMSNDQ